MARFQTVKSWVFVLAYPWSIACFAQNNENTIAELKAQIAALQILKIQLETQLNESRQALFEKQCGVDIAQPKIQLDPNLPAPSEFIFLESNKSAIDQTLISRGISLPAAWHGDIAPEISWTQGRNSDYYSSISMTLGLLNDFAVSFHLPYEKTINSDGTLSQGVASSTVSLSKALVTNSFSLPSLVATVSYTDSFGMASDSVAPIIQGLGLSLAISKPFEPLVVSGSAFYQVTKSGGNLTNQKLGYYQLYGAKIIGAGTGLSLAVTPESSIDIGLTLAKNLNSDIYYSSSAETEYVGLSFGASFLIRKNTFVYFSFSKEISRGNAPLSLGISFPYHF